MSRERLFELAAQADEQLNEFYAPVAGATQEEEDRRRGASVPRMAVRGGAIAGGLIGAEALMSNRGNVRGIAKDAARKGLKKTARGAGLASNALYKKATAAGVPYGNDLLRRGAGMASGGLARISKRMRGVARGFEVEQLDRIVDLAARIEELEMREFGGAAQFRMPKKGDFAEPLKVAAGLGRKAQSGGNKLKEVIRKNPKAALAIAGAGAATGAGAALLKRGSDKRKRKEELLARFKGKSAAQ